MKLKSLKNLIDKFDNVEMVDDYTIRLNNYYDVHISYKNSERVDVDCITYYNIYGGFWPKKTLKEIKFLFENKSEIEKIEMDEKRIYSYNYAM